MSKSMSQILFKLGQQPINTAAEFVAHTLDHEFNGTGNQQEMRSFLTLANDYTGNRKGDPVKQVGKMKAIAILIDLIATSHGSTPKFTKLNLNKCVYQLAIRVLEPRRINQTEFGLCGPAHFAVTLAKVNPAAYVQFAVELLITGKGTLGSAEYAPVEGILSFDPGLTIPQADWLVAASIRNAAKPKDGSFGSYENSTPREVFQWFVNAGFKSVIQIAAYNDDRNDDYALHTLSNLVPSFLANGIYENYKGTVPQEVTDATSKENPLVNIQLAKSLAEAGWRVHLTVSDAWAAFADPSPERQMNETDLFDAKKPARVLALQSKDIYKLQDTEMQKRMTNKIENEAYSPSPPLGRDTVDKAINEEKYALNIIKIPTATHWIIANKIDLDISGDSITIKRTSWGAKETTKPYSLKSFCKGYSGFVAAKF